MESFITATLKTKDFQILPLAGDASARKYYRVVHDDKSLVLMQWEPFSDDDNYPFLSVLKHFAKHDVHVPAVVAKDPAQGLVLLEDLGDLTLERKFWESQNQDLVLPFYFQAMDEIVKIHYPATQDHTTSCTAFKIAFDTEKLLWEMNYGREHLLEKLAEIELTTAEAKTLQSIFTDICTILDREPKVICHRDYHSRNLMIKLGEMRVIDFQDARMGPIQYDLVSLVHDSYVALSEESITKILDYYLGKAHEWSKHSLAREHFFEIFELQMIQRCFKACGSFASFYNLRQDRRYLKYIHNTINKVAKILGRHSQYSGFLDILVDRGLLGKKFDTI